MEKLLSESLFQFIDLIISPFTFLGSVLLWFIRRRGIGRFPIAKKIFLRVGIFPIRDHYYEPLFSPKYLTKSLNDDRHLPAIDWNVDEQLKLLNCFDYNHELTKFPQNKAINVDYYFDNESYGPGDSEMLYNMIRYFKPRKIIEIGSGYSTLMANNAITENLKEIHDYQCDHICVEPYEFPWLEAKGVQVIRKKVEEIDLSFFTQLDKNDLLFIDSSHIIRPQGDVLFEYLEVLPILKTGVIVHIHDIFSPKDYKSDWILKDVRFWNEQYLLEAFLSFNNSYKILSALNFLHQKHYNELSNKW